jgi:hypothetical protein
MSQRADTRYGFDIYPWWNNLNDRVAYEREFATGNPTKMRIAQAMLSQDPLTPDAEIRRNMTAKPQSRFGVKTEQIGIRDVLSHYYGRDAALMDQNHRLWNDFSGSDGETNSTDRPYLAVW